MTGPDVLALFQRPRWWARRHSQGGIRSLSGNAHKPTIPSRASVSRASKPRSWLYWRYTHERASMERPAPRLLTPRPSTHSARWRSVSSIVHSTTLACVISHPLLARIKKAAHMGRPGVYEAALSNCRRYTSRRVFATSAACRFSGSQFASMQSAKYAKL